MATTPRPPVRPYTPPAKPVVPQAEPNQPAPRASVTATKQVQVNIHGQPPREDMAPPPPSDDTILTDATKAEMAAGKKNLEQYEDKTQAEMAYGRRQVDARNPPPEPENGAETDTD